MDLNKLTDHVLCTPFFKRNDLDPSLFSDEQLQHMKNLAESHKMSLDMKSFDGEKSDSVSDPVNLSSDDIDFDDDLLLHNYLSKSLEISSVPHSTTNLKTVHDDELDELLNITPNILTTKNDSNIPGIDFKNPLPNTEENLEEWLDDFLGSWLRLFIVNFSFINVTIQWNIIYNKIHFHILNRNHSKKLLHVFYLIKDTFPFFIYTHYHNPSIDLIKRSVFVIEYEYRYNIFNFILIYIDMSMKL